VDLRNYNNIEELSIAELKILWESVCGTFIKVYETDNKFYKGLQDFRPSNNEAINYIMDFFVICEPKSSLIEIRQYDTEIDFNDVFVVSDEFDVTEMEQKIAEAVSDFLYENLKMPNY